MTIRIGSSNASLASQRALATASERVADTGQHLASGLRITKSSDDAAGLAIATSLNVSSRIYSQSIRNLNDGLSIFAIAAASLSQLSTITTRQEELAEQAANGVYSMEQRAALNAEASSLTKEYNRIVATTSFNGLKLLDGSLGTTLELQAGGRPLSLSIGSNFGRTVGDGTFGASVTLDAWGAVRNTATGDFNGDGLNDVAIASYGNSRIRVTLAQSTGSYTVPTSVGNSGIFQYPITLDVNNDGKLDIATTTSGNTAFVLVSNGDGTFKAGLSLSIGNDGGGRLMVAGDLNGDGATDLVASNRGDATVSVIMGNGDGTFRASRSYGAAIGAFGLTLGDFNGDGKLDAVGVGGNACYILAGLGDGTFKASTTITSIAGTGLQMLKSADINNDGKLDLISSDYLTSKAFVSLGNGDGTFRAFSSYLVGGTNIVGLDIGDLNGDGYTDLVTASPIAGTVTALLGNGDGTFGTSFSRNTYTNADGVELADINRDGVLDLLVSDWTRSAIDVAHGKAKITLEMPALSLSTHQGARDSVKLLSSLRENIGLRLGAVGASESRAGAALRSLSQQREAMEAAHSRIVDADVAKESAEFLRQSIQQQAATSVLAQASRISDIVLSLLR